MNIVLAIFCHGIKRSENKDIRLIDGDLAVEVALK